MSLAEDQPLPLRISSSDDDGADEITVRSRLQSLLNESATPLQAARDFDAWVVSEAERRLEKFRLRTGQDRYNPSHEEEAQGVDDIRAIGPYPEGQINELFKALAKVCSSFPPFHDSQNLIFDFLGALKDLPQREVPHLTPVWRLYDGNTGELSDPQAPGWETMSLWAFEDAEGDLRSLLESRFREEAELVYSYECSDIETLDSELRIRWRNFQSFIARLTVSGLADCTYICSLRDILPSSPQYPDLAARKIGGPNRISGDAVAGAQWLMWPDHGRWLYERCIAPGHVEDPWGIYNMQGWAGWKKQFEWIREDERFDARSKIVARLTLSQMEGFEAEDAAEAAAKRKAENRTRLP